MTPGIYCMDCMDGMREMPDNAVDLAIVDPPYGIGEDASHNESGDRPTKKWANPESQKYKVFDDSSVPDVAFFRELLRVSSNQIVWGGQFFPTLPVSKGWIVWDKRAAISECLSMCELAWSSFDMRVLKFTHLWAGFKKAKPEKRIHPTQKPVALYKWLLANYAKPGQTILDTHMGSGSSYIACLDMGFEYTGFEIDADYFKAIEERVYQFTRQTSLFAEVGT